MSLSPFDSFQSRFVTYLLNFPHNMFRRQNQKRCDQTNEPSFVLFYVSTPMFLSSWIICNTQTLAPSSKHVIFPCTRYFLSQRPYLFIYLLIYLIYCSENLASTYRVTNCSKNQFTTVSFCLFM